MSEEPRILYSIENEKSALGSLLFGPKIVAKVMPMLQEGYFHYPPHRALFKAMKNLALGNKSIDPVTLESELLREGTLEDAGGRAMILRIAEAVPSPKNAQFYAENVRELWVLRGLEQLGTDAQTLARTEGMLVSEKISELRRSLDKIQHSTRVDGFNLREIDPTKQRDCHSSAFMSLNENSRDKKALVCGQVHVYGAREGIGKSTTLVTEALHQYQHGRSGIYYTMTDLNENDLLGRCMRQLTGWERRPYSPELATKWDEAYKDFTDPFREDGGLVIFTGKVHGRRIDEVLANIRAYASDNKVDYILIDYFQRIRERVGNRQSATETLVTHSEAIADLAEDLNCPIILACQVTETEFDIISKGSRGPQEDCAIAMWMKRDKETPDHINCRVSKMRFGNSEWTFQMRFDKTYMKMVDIGTPEE